MEANTARQSPLDARLRLLESILENANDAILVTEAEPVESPGPRIVYINNCFTRMTGYTPEEVIGKTPRILQGPRTDRAELEKLKRALKRWKPVRVELLNYRKDGTEFWVELNIVPVADETGWFTHWISIQRETTERKQADEAARRSEERFLASLAQNSSDIASIFEADGELRYLSPSVERLLGIPPQELVGGDIFSRVHPDDLARLLAAFAEAVGKPGVGRPVEFRARHADGAWRHLEAVCNNLLNDPAVQGLVVNAWDVTERKRAEDQLRLRDRAISASSNGIMITDAKQPDNPIVYVNPAFERITGYSAADIIGRNCRILQGRDREQADLPAIGAAIAAGREASGVVRNYRKDGSLFYNELSISPVHDEGGRLSSFIGIMNDITERRALEEQLAHQAYHDPLTDLPNRALFMDRLQQSLSRGARRGSSVAALFLDLDSFKVVNDSLGHEVGDRLLVAVARHLRAALRPEDLVARLGGDEFTVLVEDVTGAGDALRVAERIGEALRTPFDVDGRPIFTTASIGIALSGTGHDDPAGLLRATDIAMYRAKLNGKARHEVFDPSMSAPVLQRLELETQLRRAIDNGELQLYYQPKVLLSSGATIGLEALLRWEHPDRGLVPPAEFIPLAEETGLILPIGRWVLEEACAQARRWQDQQPAGAPLLISVNLSARQFQQPRLVEEVASVLDATGLDAGCLVLEITESVAMEGAESNVATLRALRDLGVRIAIDDFGTGYSSLSYLKRFPVDMLKIDKSFVDGLGQDEEDTSIVRAVVGLGRSLHLKLIAEGVETAEQLAKLRALGCELGQGYLFARPLPAEAIDRALATPAA